MTDIFDSAKRSEVMSKIRGRGNASTEIAMVTILRAAHVTGWRRQVELRPRPVPSDMNTAKKTKSGRIRIRPDFIFREAKLALFVDGCFWHGCPLHATQPKKNAEFWKTKLQGNIRRDAQHTRALNAVGWNVLRVWEHELCDTNTLIQRIKCVLRDKTRGGQS